ncbi:MAG TPA: RimK family alpha-L-glutamate ligase [Micromonosporaceae bacterium]|nr:RimK family alpha-L-glutamate ligase [Micromonosporaceae bacterium]
MEVAIAVSRTGAEEQRLYDAARAQGLPARLCTVDECASDGRGWPPETVVLNRVLGLTQALALAHLLEADGIRSVNSAAVISSCGSKVATTACLRAAGVAMPDTRVAFSRQAALAAIEEIGYPVVVKPVVGSWGRLLAKVNDRDAAEAVLGYQEALPSAAHSVYYLQRFVGAGSRDLRALVTGDRVVCVVERRAGHWIRNLSRHQQPHPVRPTDEITKCAQAAAAAVGGGVVGVDLLEDADGRLFALEVNHRPEFRWTQQAAGSDIASAVIDWVRGSAP